MSEKEYVSQDERKITWGLTRKVNLGNYESIDVSIYMTDFVPEDTTPTEMVTGNSEAAFDMLKQEVYSALDLDFEFDEEGHPKLVKSSLVQQPQAARPPTAQPQQGPRPQGSPSPQAPRQENPSISQVGIYGAEPTFCRDCGAQGLAAFEDNRLQFDDNIKAGKKIGPDFKCLTCGGGAGTNKAGKATPIYRPGSCNYNQQVGQTGTQAPMAPPPDESPF